MLTLRAWLRALESAIVDFLSSPPAIMAKAEDFTAERLVDVKSAAQTLHIHLNVSCGGREDGVAEGIFRATVLAKLEAIIHALEVDHELLPRLIKAAEDARNGIQHVALRLRDMGSSIEQQLAEINTLISEGDASQTQLLTAQGATLGLIAAETVEVKTALDNLPNANTPAELEAIKVRLLASNQRTAQAVQAAQAANEAITAIIVPAEPPLGSE